MRYVGGGCVIFFEDLEGGRKEEKYKSWSRVIREVSMVCGIVESFNKGRAVKKLNPIDFSIFTS